MRVRLTIASPGDALVYCAGKCVIWQRNNSAYEAELETDGETVINIVDRPEQLVKGYGWQAILFWIIGLAGLFTPRYEKRCLDLDCALRFDRDTSLRLTVLKRNDRNATQRAVYYESDAPVTEIGNPAYAVSKLARRRRKIYYALSWLARIAVTAAIVLAVI